MSSRPTKSAPSFVTKLYTIVDSGNTDVVDWHRGGTSFIIKDAERFSKLCLTPNFKSSLFSSFVRQLHFCKCVPHLQTHTLTLPAIASSQRGFTHFCAHVLSCCCLPLPENVALFHSPLTSCLTQLLFLIATFIKQRNLTLISFVVTF